MASPILCDSPLSSTLVCCRRAGASIAGIGTLMKPSRPRLDVEVDKINPPISRDSSHCTSGFPIIAKTAFNSSISSFWSSIVRSESCIPAMILLALAMRARTPETAAARSLGDRGPWLPLLEGEVGEVVESERRRRERVVWSGGIISNVEGGGSVAGLLLAAGILANWLRISMVLGASCKKRLFEEV